ncbi:phage tail assembly protein T [Bordetella hinzii]|jgi:hypothetical protein|uniref:phage tail assembly protein T n=1 Tax=Bordetella hinzii TaxID=103855 RepID=UPI00045A6FD7|nr:DUF4035 domain-containing protein [Bordetella hinzii]KCB48557.1 PF13227 family protein [Bordetella hinzii 4161]KXA70626.1 phage tail protein [Bordetella hinzii LMG 13501]QDJ37923.1 phage tail protein [Bordetella hinzii]VEH25054.1 Uncharacterised protein [Bordetella hinzii]
MVLALRLGRSLGEILEGVDTYEVSLWREFDRLSPLGDVRADILTAHLAATVARSAGVKVQAEDMLLRWGGDEKPTLSDGELSMKAFLLGQANAAK